MSPTARCDRRTELTGAIRVLPTHASTLTASTPVPRSVTPRTRVQMYAGCVITLQASPEPLTLPHSCRGQNVNSQSSACSPNTRAGRRSVHCSPSGPSPLLLGAGFPRSPPSRVHRHHCAHTRTPGWHKAVLRRPPAAARTPGGRASASRARVRSRCPCPLEPALPPLGSGSPAAPTAQLRETGREPCRQRHQG